MSNEEKDSNIKEWAISLKRDPDQPPTQILFYDGDNVKKIECRLWGINEQGVFIIKPYTKEELKPLFDALSKFKPNKNATDK